MTSTIRDTQTAQYPSQWLDIFRVITLKWWFLPVSLEALQCPPPSTDLTPVTPSFHICKVKQKSQRQNPSPALPRLLFLYQTPKPHLPTPEMLWFIPNSAAGIAAWCSKCYIPPSCPKCTAAGHATASPKSPRTEPSWLSCVLTHASKTNQAPKSLQDQGLPSLWIIPTQFQVNYCSYTCIAWF